MKCKLSALISGTFVNANAAKTDIAASNCTVVKIKNLPTKLSGFLSNPGAITIIPKAYITNKTASNEMNCEK